MTSRKKTAERWGAQGGKGNAESSQSECNTIEDARKVERLAKDLGDLYQLLNCGSIIFCEGIETSKALMLFTPAMEKVYQALDALDASKPETSEAAYQALMGAAVHMQVIAQGICEKRVTVLGGAL